MKGLNHKHIHKDIMIRLRLEGKPQTQLAKELGVTANLFQGIVEERGMMLTNYIKLTNWLEKPMEYYITKKLNKYEK